VIRVRKGSVPTPNGGRKPRKDERAVIEQRKHKARAPYRVHGFGYKCRVEGVSSTIERVFGDYVTAKKFVDTAKEMVMKAFICNAERSSPVLKPLVGGRKEGLLIRCQQATMHWEMLPKKKVAEIPYIVRSLVKQRRFPTIRDFKVYTGLGRKIVMPLPQSAQIEVTTKCNFNCIYCSRQSLNKERLNRDMTFEQFKRIIDQIPLRSVKLQGLGEPFLNKNIGQMAQYAKSRGINVTTTSNGSIVPDINTLKFFDEIRISFDSANKLTFESLRRGAHFDSILNNITELIRIKNENKLRLRLALTMVVSHLNYFEMEEAAKIAFELGVEELGFVEVENWYIPSQREFPVNSEFVKRAREKHAEIESKVLELRKRYKSLDIAYLSSAKRKRTCPWSFYYTFITVDGYMTPCCIRMDKDVFYFGNVFQTAFAEIWNNEKMRRFREANIKDLPNPVCDLCPD